MPRCKICRTKCERLGFIALCSTECANILAQQAWEKQRKAKERQLERARKRQKQKDTKRKKELRTRAQWYQVMQPEFNKMIRNRDEGQPCISCGRSEAEVMAQDTPRHGTYFDAGHFHSRGARPEIRFHPDNVHRQCIPCNGGSGKYARKGYTVAKEYEERLRAKIGDAAVDALNGPQPSLKELYPTWQDLEAELKRWRKINREHGKRG